MDIFGGVITNWTIFRGHFQCILGSFQKVKVRMENIFLVAKTSNIYLGCLKFMTIFFLFFFFWGGGGGGGTVDAGPESTYEENLRVQPPWVCLSV